MKVNERDNGTEFYVRKADLVSEVPEGDNDCRVGGKISGDSPTSDKFITNDTARWVRVYKSKTGKSVVYNTFKYRIQ